MADKNKRYPTKKAEWIALAKSGDIQDCASSKYFRDKLCATICLAHDSHVSVEESSSYTVWKLERIAGPARELRKAMTHSSKRRRHVRYQATEGKTVD